MIREYTAEEAAFDENKRGGIYGAEML